MNYIYTYSLRSSKNKDVANSFLIIFGFDPNPQFRISHFHMILDVNNYVGLNEMINPSIGNKLTHRKSCLEIIAMVPTMSTRSAGQ